METVISVTKECGEKLEFSWGLITKQVMNHDVDLRFLQIRLIVSSDIESAILNHLADEIEQAVRTVIDRYPNP